MKDAMSDGSLASDDAKQKARVPWWFILGVLCVVLASGDLKRLTSAVNADPPNIRRSIVAILCSFTLNFAAIFCANSSSIL